MENLSKLSDEELGDAHIMTSSETPLRKDAFEKTNTEKIKHIAYHFEQIMLELGLDLTDDSLRGTPFRFAKMYVTELFAGLDPKTKPKLSVFDNKYGYGKMLVETNINVYSSCEHHFLPIVGKASIAYIAKNQVIGLSKINRIVDYYARRPQVQERLTLQIYNELKETLSTEDIIVVIEAEHLCVSARGVKDTSSKTVTMEYTGAFLDNAIRNDFMKLI